MGDLWQKKYEQNMYTKYIYYIPSFFIMMMIIMVQSVAHKNKRKNEKNPTAAYNQNTAEKIKKIKKIYNIREYCMI